MIKKCGFGIKLLLFILNYVIFRLCVGENISLDK
jgi:hypothetical protein